MRLQEVVKIDYSWESIDIVSRPMNGLLRGVCEPEAQTAAYNLSVEPDDISISDKVTVIWRIE